MKFIYIIFAIILFLNNNNFSQNWSTPIVIGNSNYSTRADIVIDSNNLVHVVFEVNERGDHYPDNIYYTFYNGQEWVSQINISNTDTTSQFPDIKVDKDNSIHIIWGDPKYFHFKDIWHTTKKNEEWAKPNSLFHAQSDTFKISKIRYDFDTQNKMHLIWFHMPFLKYRYIKNNDLSDIKAIKWGGLTHDFRIYNDRIHLTYKRGALNGGEALHYKSFDIDSVVIDSSYHPDTNVVRYVPEHPVRDPQIFIDSKSRVHLIWIEGTDPDAWANEIYHCYSDDDGLSWSDAVDITHNGGTSHYPGVVIDSKDQIHIVWAQSLYTSSLVTAYIGYVKFDGETWSEPKEILSPVNSWPNIAIDSENFLHITYDVKLDGEHKVVYSTTSPTTDIVLRKDDELPLDYKLFQNYPNPFNSSTTITFSIPAVDEVSLFIYNIKGEIVKRIIKNNILQSGSFSFKWDGTDDSGNILSSGTYFYQLKAGDFIKTKKLVLLK